MVFRLNLLVITTVLALFATFAAILAHNSYNTELQMLVADLEADVQSASQLQLAYYQQDKKSLKQFLVSAHSVTVPSCKMKGSCTLRAGRQPVQTNIFTRTKVETCSVSALGRLRLEMRAALGRNRGAFLYRGRP